MAAIDFPDAPTTGQAYEKWTWNGSQWVLTNGGLVAGFTALTLINGFSVLGGFGAPAWRPGQGDCVELRGQMVVPALAASSGGTKFSTLPIPALPKILTISGWAGTSRLAEIRITTAGDAQFYVEGGDAAWAAGAWVTLDGVQYQRQ